MKKNYLRELVWCRKLHRHVYAVHRGSKPVGLLQQMQLVEFFLQRAELITCQCHRLQMRRRRRRDTDAGTTASAARHRHILLP